MNRNTKDEKLYKCTICSVMMTNLFQVKEHNNGKKHRTILETRASKFRHPTINADIQIEIINDNAAAKPKEIINSDMAGIQEVYVYSLLNYLISNLNSIFIKNGSCGQEN